MTPEWVALGKHLWQSTLFAGAAALLALALKKNRAAARYWLWMAASMKFLVPFSVLAMAGSRLGNLLPDAPAPELYHAMRQIGLPAGPEGFFLGAAVSRAAPPHSGMVLALLWVAGFAAALIAWWMRWRSIRAAVRDAARVQAGPELDALRRIERAAGIGRPIELRSGTTALEPGVFGVLRPVLVLPRGFAERLGEGQLEAILAHEVCHVRRRDNVAAAVHMLVEATFWFHPLVWWLGARLIDERERACDEEVLELGSEPRAYAESILKACEFCLESPLACVSGVTGADLKKRIERIMADRAARRLDFGRKLLLATIGMAAVAGPIAVGLLNAPRSQAQWLDATAGSASFEVASIRPAKPDKRGFRISGPLFGGEFSTGNTSLKRLLAFAYNVHDFQVSGGPAWAATDGYDINAKTPGEQKATQAEARQMMRNLLAERFRVSLRRVTKEMPVYALVVAKNGPKLEEAKAAEGGPRIDIRMGRRITAERSPIGPLAELLSWRLGRVVLDRTGLAGNYRFTLEWTPDESMPRGGEEGSPAVVPPPDENGPSLFAAVQEQLGLKLVATRAPVEIVVIDRAERPSEN